MLQYILIGLALGSIYAIASSGLVVTYVSSGVLNFAFGSMAYVVARFYYWLNSQHGWATSTSGLMSILVVAPLMGVILYAVLFRFLRGKSTLIKLVATIGLSVALPPVADLVLRHPGDHLGTRSGALERPAVPFLRHAAHDRPGHHLWIPALHRRRRERSVLRFTDVGLRVRAIVDSEAMASLSGSNPGRVALGVWAVSSTLAGHRRHPGGPDQRSHHGRDDDPDGGRVRRRGRAPGFGRSPVPWSSRWPWVW